MSKLEKALLLFIPIWAYLGIYQLQYSVWDFALTQNWFTQNGLVLFKDVIYHHTQLPLFTLFAMSKIFGNTPDMLRFSSFLMLIALSLGIFLLGREVSRKVSTMALGIFFITFFPLFQNFNMEEMMASIFSVYATYFCLKFWNKLSPKWIFISGLFTALAIMSKQSVVLLIGVFFLIGVKQILLNKKILNLVLKSSVLFLGGLTLGAAPFILYYLYTNSLGDFLYWNIIFNFTIYPAQSTAYALKDGLFASAWMYAAIIPAVYLFLGRNYKYRLQISLLILCTIFLSVSMLPSFLVYKILPFYPYPVILWAMLIGSLDKKMIKVFLVIGIILLLPILKSFYVDYLPGNIFNSSYILDYGQDELDVVSWLEKNTGYKEPIMNLGNHYITTLSKRMPANKYVYLFPWLVSPFDKSTKDILKNPPHIVIVDWRTFSDFSTLNKWPFINFVKNNYKVVAKFDTYEIFSNKN